MAKLTTTDLVNISGVDEAEATRIINYNFTLIQQALENTLSRDGAQPNVMKTSIDMDDTYTVINLPDAVSDNEIANLGQVLAGATLIGVSVSDNGTVILSTPSDINFDSTWDLSLSGPTVTLTASSAIADIKWELLKTQSTITDGGTITLFDTVTDDAADFSEICMIATDVRTTGASGRPLWSQFRVEGGGFLTTSGQYEWESRRYFDSGTIQNRNSAASTLLEWTELLDGGTCSAYIKAKILNPGNTSKTKPIWWSGAVHRDGGSTFYVAGHGLLNTTSAVDAFDFFSTGGAITGGPVYFYGRRVSS
jgi:hypothetical protein